jgi:hypothetical protein
MMMITDGKGSAKHGFCLFQTHPPVQRVCVCVQNGQLEDPLAFCQSRPGTDHEESVVAHSHTHSLPTEPRTRRQTKKTRRHVTMRRVWECSRQWV